ncbi:HEPN domain-containing protein [Candidatus Woesearchaeota archaeon]|nr:HEPN domain-containing protein [Candidatus Woesearchaeota archaeon]
MMKFDYNNEFKQLLEEKSGKKYFIRESQAKFKIKLFLEKSKGSFSLVNYVDKCSEVEKLFVDYWAITISYYSMLYAAKAAILAKGYETDDHYATQIALGALLVPSELEKEDLELLEQGYKIFEEEYVEYLQDAHKESNLARYQAIRKYSERRVKDIIEKTRKFISKIELVLEGRY